MYSGDNSKILQWTGLISIIFYIGSIIFNYIFFNHFNIKINNYIDYSEYILLIINDLGLVVSSILMALLLGYLPIFDRFFNNIIKNKERAVSWEMVVFSLFMLFIIYYKKLSIEFLLNITNFIVFVFTIFMFLIISIKKIRYFSIKNHLIIMIVIFMLSMTVNSFEKIKIYENRTIDRFVSFFYEGNYNSTNNNCYILLGMTKNYIFLWNKYLLETSIYKIDDVHDLKITKYKSNAPK